jgi:hypothetical protein
MGAIPLQLQCSGGIEQCILKISTVDSVLLLFQTAHTLQLYMTTAGWAPECIWRCCWQHIPSQRQASNHFHCISWCTRLITGSLGSTQLLNDWATTLVLKCHVATAWPRWVWYVYLTCFDGCGLLAANQPVMVCLFGWVAPTHVGMMIWTLCMGVHQTYVPEKGIPASFKHSFTYFILLTMCRGYIHHFLYLVFIILFS